MENKNLLEKNIISELGLDDLSEEKKTGLINKISELVEKRITLRLMREIGKEKVNDFSKLEKQDDDAKMKFLQDNVPNLESVIQEEVVKVKKEIIEESQKNN